MDIRELLSKPRTPPPEMDLEHAALVKRQNDEFEEALKNLSRNNAEHFQAMNARHAGEHRALREKYGYSRAKGE